MAMVFVVSVYVSLFLLTSNVASGIGVNWGSSTSRNLRPDIAVQLLKDNGINKVKLFGSDPMMIKAFAKTGIDVIVGVPNQDLQKFSDSYDKAKDWVKGIAKHVNYEGVSIKYVAVGNEPFLKTYNGIFLKTTFPAIKNIQKALDDAGLGDKIKATTPISEEAYEQRSQEPSLGDFRPDIKDALVEMVRWFDTNKSPFLVNIYPYRGYHDSEYSESSVFFDPNAKLIVTDKKTIYTNFFDISIDTLAWALKNAGAPNVNIMVGEIGWPTDGSLDANATLAQKFYSGFLKKVASEKGTPLKPGPMEIYLSSLLDENMRSIARGNHERHWGIFKFDGQPKFPIDFLGQGRDVMPVPAKGVKYLPLVYCSFNKDSKTNMSIVPELIEYACKAVDCTALSYGSSCNNLDYIGNLTYIFNMYYQMYDQIGEACIFNGLSTISITNPSNGTCFFPVQMSGAGLRMHFGVREIIVGVLVMFFLAFF